MHYKNILFFSFILLIIGSNSVSCMTIFQAAQKGDILRIRTLLAQNIYINQVNIHGQSPLHIATKNGHCKLVEYLLQHGANINLKDFYGRTPLHYAVLYNQVHITQQLLKHRSNPDEQDDCGFGSLHLALVLPQRKLSTTIKSTLENQKYAIIKLLLEHKAMVNMPIQTNTKPICLYLGQAPTPYHFYTPLMYALKQEQIIHYASLIRLLIAYGASKEIKSSDGTTALGLVTRTRHFPIWYMMQYPLHEAATANDSYCVERLLQSYTPQSLDIFGRQASILAPQESTVDEMMRSYNQRKLTN